MGFLKKRSASKYQVLSVNEELEREVEELRMVVNRLSRIAQAADTFMASLRVTEPDGTYKAMINIEKDAEHAEIVRHCAWNLESELYGKPAPPPMNYDGTVH